jgi:UDP-2,3-diacylglucosamine pyrophosphatase LpxH
MVVINDIHVGSTRIAGTTPVSSLALKHYILDSFSNFMSSIDEDVIIVGDLFDQWSVSLKDVLGVYEILHAFLLKGHKLIAVAANHDLSTDSSKFGSLQFLMALLANHKNLQFVIGEGAWVGEGMYCVPHMPNQDSFDLELSRVPECEVLFLHANLDNGFAAQADHSLNVSREQLAKLPANLVYFGHEHHARQLGKAFVGGVQWPTSVSDCLDKKDKYAYRLEGTTLTPIKTWDASNYVEMDWRSPAACKTQFIRFVGECDAEEAADMANVISAYRRTSEAFVVANAVSVSNQTDINKLTSLEEVNKFNVLDALRSYLSEEEVAILEKLNA